MLLINASAVVCRKLISAGEAERSASWSIGNFLQSNAKMAPSIELIA
jgi:hypothetical protein